MVQMVRLSHTADISPRFLLLLWLLLFFPDSKEVHVSVSSEAINSSQNSKLLEERCNTFLLCSERSFHQIHYFKTRKLNSNLPVCLFLFNLAFSSFRLAITCNNSLRSPSKSRAIISFFSTSHLFACTSLRTSSSSTICCFNRPRTVLSANEPACVASATALRFRPINQYVMYSQSR